QTRIKKLHQGILIDAGFVEALKQGRIEIVSAVREVDDGGVVLVDGTRLRRDVVIAATAYRRGLEPLGGDLGVLDAGGQRVGGGRPTADRRGSGRRPPVPVARAPRSPSGRGPAPRTAGPLSRGGRGWRRAAGRARSQRSCPGT